MDIETLELADATREQAQAIERQTSALEAHVVALKSVSKGEQGDKGDTGDTGPQGGTGPQGVRGLQGIKGDKGNTGGTGPKGDKGDKGDQGDAGKDGVGPDERVKVGIDDPRPGFLVDKLEAGEGVTLKRKKSPTGHSLVINAFPQAGGSSGGGGSAGLIVYDDGVAVGTGNKVSYDGGDPVTIAGGIIHVPVGCSDDQTAAEVPFTPAGGVVATNVQAAIEEVAAGAGSGTGAPFPPWTEGGHGDVTAETDNDTTPIKIIAPESGSDGPYGLEIDAAGPGYTGAIMVVTGDPSGLTGNGYVMRVMDEVGGRQTFDLDAWGSISIKAPVTGGAGILVQAGNGATVMDVQAGANAAASTVTFGGLLSLLRLRVVEYFNLGATSAPADGDFPDGTVTFWFDPTNGAASPMWKGKQADGTVVSGSLGGGGSSSGSFLSIAKWT